jgi:6,7-dimethyl-8-ribityllumazine synthase
MRQIKTKAAGSISASNTNTPKTFELQSQIGSRQSLQGTTLTTQTQATAQLTIGIVQSRFNEEVTNALRDACVDELLASGIEPENITWIEVPGALEIPIVLQSLALTGRYNALIALGCVIRGETYHFELVSNESASGVTRISLDHHIPIINAVITTENYVQALVRQEEKGREAAKAAIEMSLLLGSLT